jgi:hypothetical protein
MSNKCVEKPAIRNQEPATRNERRFLGPPASKYLTFLLEKFYHPILCDETGLAIQRHLHWRGILTIILPIRVKL